MDGGGQGGSSFLESPTHHGGPAGLGCVARLPFLLWLLLPEAQGVEL